MVTLHSDDDNFLVFLIWAAYQITFFIFFTTIGLNIIFGIIVDTFSELRDLKVIYIYIGFMEYVKYYIVYVHSSPHTHTHTHTQNIYDFTISVESRERHARRMFYLWFAKL